MGLRDLKIPEAIIGTTGGDFAVRGLSLDDVQYLVSRHGDKLRKLFTDFMASETELTPEGIADFIVPLLDSMPDLLADVIACASGDAADADVVRRLPFPVQIGAIEPIAALSFDGAGGPKKFVETVVRLAQGTTGMLEGLRT